jgi:NADPH:quinone reductase-like Zn-dependent oxidoreductase
MKAFEISAHEPGRLVAVERPEPRPGPREVLVAMSAASLNARDLQILDGHYPISKPLPLVPLSDGVGRVIALGDEVTRVERGERVLGTFAQRWLRGRRSDDTWASTLGADLDGVLQERIVLHEDGLVRAPSHLSDEEAATLPCAGVTAWQALVTAGNVRADETVLVQGTGAVALFALQFA